MMSPLRTGLPLVIPAFAGTTGNHDRVVVLQTSRNP